MKYNFKEKKYEKNIFVDAFVGYAFVCGYDGFLR